MKRAIITPAALPPAALAELKQWLGISTAHDDALLTQLLNTSLDMCEAFTGIMPIECVCEEIVPAKSGWQVISTRPVQSIIAAEAISASGNRTPLASSSYQIDLSADGAGRVRIVSSGDTTRVAVRFQAGLAPDWDTLPSGLRQGVMRLAAHQHRERENAGAAPVPPAAVAAFWRPWRRMRLT